MRPTPSQTRRARGFSLIELIIATGVSVIAVSAASMALLSQYRSLQGQDLTRMANAETRTAITQVEESLRSAGWGIDPRYALDEYTCTTWPCRDSTSGPDELVFVARNSMYLWLDNGQTVGGNSCNLSGGCFYGNAWSISTVNTTSTPHTVTVTLPSGVTLHKGRIVLAMCASAQSPVMFTLSQTYTGAGTPVTLTPVATNAVPYNDAASIAACHGQAGAGLFLVDRYRYFIQTLTNTNSGTTASAATSWLMLDRGLDLDGDGSLPPGDQDDLIPVAKNVMDMQVAYALNRGTGTAPDNNTDWVISNNGSSSSVEEPNPTATAPSYTDLSTASARFTLNPANVRGVRVSLVIRSDRKDLTHGSTWAGDTVTYTENRSGSLTIAGYRLYTAQTEITLRNLDSKLAFLY